MDDLVSVIIPIYNRAKYLNQCINSVLMQTYTTMQIILVDDGSTDSSPQLCDKFSLQDPRIEVIHKENGGLSSARNCGLKHTRGRYIAFLDSDDFWRNDYLEVMVTMLQKTGAQIAQCILYSVPSNYVEAKTDYNTEAPIYTEMTMRQAMLSPAYKVCACAKLFDASVLEGVLFPEGLVFEDEATYYRFLWNAERVCIIDEKLYYYRQTDNSITRNNSTVLKWDFVEVFNQRMQFFEQIGDQELLQETYARYAIVLMLKHSSCKKKHISKESQKKIVALFRGNWDRLKLTKMPFLKRVVLSIYRVCPDMTAHLLCLLRK